MFSGHSQTWNLLKTDFEKKKVAPAYIFYGLPGIGKALVAKEWAKLIFGDSEKIDNNNHPDFHTIEPDGKQIKIETLRNLKEELYKSPFEASLHFVLINEAEKLTPQSSNSLLKVLEEPLSQTLFVLVTPNLFQIMPTIRSRSRSIYFSPPKLEDSLKILENLGHTNPQTNKEILSLTDGSPGLAHILLGSDAQNILTLFDSISTTQKMPFKDIVKTTEKIVDESDNLGLCIDVFKKKLLYKHMEDKNPLWLAKIDRLSLARQDWERNVNKNLLIENLFLDLTS